VLRFTDSEAGRGTILLERIADNVKGSGFMSEKDLGRIAELGAYDCAG
jgi:hypothetical protein